MTTKSFFPYRTQIDPIKLRLDGPNEVPTREQAILAYETDLDVITLRAHTDLPEGLTKFLVPPEEAAAPPVETWLVVRSKDSRQRRAIRVPSPGEPVDVELRRGDWAGTVQIHAVLVRARANPDAPLQFGADRASILAWSDPWRIYFNEPRFPGDRLDVYYEDFRQSENPWRRLHATHLFALHAPAGARPAVFLNSAVQYCRPVLDSRGTHGAKARIRDSLFSTIAHQVWTSLLGAAVAELVSLAQQADTDPEKVLENVQEFNRLILRDWAEYLYPEVDPGTAIGRVVEARDASAAADLLARVPNAIQARFNETAGFSGLVRDYAGM